jgi:hypothetical protein
MTSLRPGIVITIERHLASIAVVVSGKLNLLADHADADQVA